MTPFNPQDDLDELSQCGRLGFCHEPGKPQATYPILILAESESMTICDGSVVTFVVWDEVRQLDIVGEDRLQMILSPNDHERDLFRDLTNAWTLFCFDINEAERNALNAVGRK
jgi:hypothetical protein